MSKKISKKDSFNKALSLIYPHENLKVDPVGFPRVVEKVENGRITQQVEFVIDDDNTDQFKCSDFALENLLAAKVDLKELRFTDLSLKAVDKFVAGVSSLDLPKPDVQS